MTGTFDNKIMDTLGENRVDTNTQTDTPVDSGASQQGSILGPDAASNIDKAIGRTEGDPPLSPNAQPTQVKKPDANAQQQQQRTGKLVDEQGNEVPANQRHHFFARRKAEEAERKASTALATANGQIEAYKRLYDGMSQSGLNAQEQATAISLGAALKKDPIATVKQLLSELKATGMNVDAAIGVAGVDTASIAKLIDSKLAPFTQQHQAEQQHQKDLQAVEDDVHNFFNEYPDATMHASAINDVLKARPEWSVDKAWYELQLMAAKNQLDITKPLPPQIQARRGTQTQGRTAQNGNRVPMQSPGRSGVGANLQPPAERSFDHTANIKDIVKSAMAGAGMDITRLN